MMRVIFAVLVTIAAASAGHRVAITIDDLPLGGGSPNKCDAAAIRDMTRRLLAPIREQHIPVTGFVNEGNCTSVLPEILKLWVEAGAELGNHTYSHADLNRTPATDFEQEILRGEPLTRAATGHAPRYFRHPFLHVGLDLEKRRTIEKYLGAHGYTIAPVTFDNSDYMFAAVYARALRAGNRALAERTRGAYLPYLESVVDFFEKRAFEVTGHDIPQILLIHANELNARQMPALLDMFRNRGYRFVSLGEALQDPAYELPDTYAGPGGFSWVHHWSITKGMPKKGEPDEPEWVREAYAAR